MRYEQKILDMKQCDSNWYMYYVQLIEIHKAMPRQMTTVLYSEVGKNDCIIFFLSLMIF